MKRSIQLTVSVHSHEFPYLAINKFALVILDNCSVRYSSTKYEEKETIKTITQIFRFHSQNLWWIYTQNNNTNHKQMKKKIRVDIQIRINWFIFVIMHSFSISFQFSLTSNFMFTTKDLYNGVSSILKVRWKANKLLMLSPMLFSIYIPNQLLGLWVSTFPNSLWSPYPYNMTRSILLAYVSVILSLLFINLFLLLLQIYYFCCCCCLLLTILYFYNNS